VFELRDLECFLAVVECGNFGRAAETLGMAQPPLSRRIAELERKLGVLLFSRERRQIEITDAGRALTREARTLLIQSRLAAQITRDAAAGFTGHLRLGFVGSSGYSIIPKAIRGFRAAYPAATLTLTELLGARQIDALRSGMIDVALVRGPVESEGLLSSRLHSYRLIAALPERHPLSQRKHVEVADLAYEPFIEFNRYGATGLHDLVRGVCAEAGFVPQVVQSVDSLDTLAACVAAGMGVSLVHDVVRMLPIDGIAYLSIKPASPPVDLSCVRRADDLNPLLPAFVECLRSAANDTLAADRPYERDEHIISDQRTASVGKKRQRNPGQRK
jgi:DNA-binding transcriptional LysR family regulator